MGVSQLPTWVQYLQALSTPAIAFAGIVIAFGQLSLAQHRFQHDLYDRRYKVFDAARKFLAEIMRDGDCQLEQIFDFIRNTGDAVFLFDSAVVGYLEEFRRRAFEIRKAVAIINVPTEPQREAAIKVKYDQLDWFTKQFPILVDKFKPSLQLRDRVRRFPHLNLSAIARSFLFLPHYLWMRLRVHFQ